MIRSFADQATEDVFDGPATRGDRAGHYSIRVNDQYRICFSWEQGYADTVAIEDYH